MALCDFVELASDIRSDIKELLLEAADYQITSIEKTPLAKTVRTCRQLLKVEPAMWLFITTEGVEPTNNAAERAIRPAVIWRRTSFGSQTQALLYFFCANDDRGYDPQISASQCFGIYDTSYCLRTRWSRFSFFTSTGNQ